MICKNCNKEIDDNNFLCPYCSYNVAEQRELIEKKKAQLERIERNKEASKNVRIDFDYIFNIILITSIFTILVISFETYRFNKRVRENNKNSSYISATLYNVEENSNKFNGNYKYLVDGKEYTFIVGDSYVAKENVPKSVTVKYSNDNPGNILEVYEYPPRNAKEESYSIVYIPIVVIGIMLLFIKICKLIQTKKYEKYEKEN